MIEFEIAGKRYKARDLDPFKAFMVARKLAPMAKIITSFGSMEEVRAIVGDGKSVDESGALAVLGPALDIIAAIPDKDVDTVLKTCLGVVEMQQPAGWASIMTAGGEFMFEMKMPLMLQIVWRVVQANMRDFFPEPAPNSSQAETP